MIKGLSSRLSDMCFETNREVLQRNYLSNLMYIRSARGVCRLAGSLKGVDVFVVGAGPSLNDAIPILSGVNGKIIACDRAVRPLLAAGVTPDFIVSVELSPLGGKKLEGLHSALSRVPLAFDPLCCPETVHQYPGPLYTWDKPTEVTGKGKMRGGTGVVSFAVGLAELMEADKVILVGVDLSYPRDRIHADGVTSICGELLEGQIEVTSVTGWPVKSDAYLACNIEELSQAASAGVRLFQTSPAGAMIPGAEHVDLRTAILV